MAPLSVHPYASERFLVSFGNAAFSCRFESPDRPDIPDQPLPLRIAPLIEASFSTASIDPSGVPAFAESDESGNVLRTSGLASFLQSDISGVPAVLFDNHNHSLFFWYEAHAAGIFDRGIPVIHIDQHSDLWDNPNDLQYCDLADLPSLARFVDEKTSVGNYVQPVIREWLVGKFVRVESEYHIREFDRSILDEPFILDLDLDFFSEEMSYVPFDLAKEFVLSVAKRAKFITIATSPHFIAPERALQILWSLFPES